MADSYHAAGLEMQVRRDTGGGRRHEDGTPDDVVGSLGRRVW